MPDLFFIIFSMPAMKTWIKRSMRPFSLLKKGQIWWLIRMNLRKRSKENIDNIKTSRYLMILKRFSSRNIKKCQYKWIIRPKKCAMPVLGVSSD